MRMIAEDGSGDPASHPSRVLLERERDEALAHARALERELGALRGRVRQLERIMYRRTASRARWRGRVARVRRVVDRLR
jgi:hypothetical protein